LLIFGFLHFSQVLLSNCFVITCYFGFLIPTGDHRTFFELRMFALPFPLSYPHWGFSPSYSGLTRISTKTSNSNTLLFVSTSSTF